MRLGLVCLLAVMLMSSGVYAAKPGPIIPDVPPRRILFDVVPLPWRTYSHGITDNNLVGVTSVGASLEWAGIPGVVFPRNYSAVLRLRGTEFETMYQTPADVVLTQGDGRGNFLGIRRTTGSMPFSVVADVPVLISTSGMRDLPLFHPWFNPQVVSRSEVIGVVPDESPVLSIGGASIGRVFRSTLEGTHPVELRIYGQSVRGQALATSERGDAVIALDSSTFGILRRRSVIWHANGSFDWLPADLADINQNGSISVGSNWTIVAQLGSLNVSGVVPEAVRYDADGLSSLKIGVNSLAYSVNNSGSIVGERSGRAILLRDGELIDLQDALDHTLGYRDLHAWSINNRGVIEASAFDALGRFVQIVLVPRS